MDIPSLFMIPSAVSSGKVHSVFPNSTDADFDFNRDSDATRVNSEGLIERVGYYGSDLVVNGNFATNSDWNLGSGDWTISNNFAIANNSNNNLHTSNPVATSTGLKYKVTFELVGVSQGYVRVGLSGLDARQFNSDGTHTLDIVSDGNRYLYFRPFGFTGKLTNVSVVEVLGDRARLNYEIEGGLVNTKPSLLLEPQSTNVFPYSNFYGSGALEVYSNGTQTHTVTNNYSISPDGTKNAIRLQATVGSSSSDRVTLRDLVTAGASTFTFSVYAKSNTDENITLGFHSGGGTPSTFVATSDWQRFTYTTTLTATSNVGVEVRGGQTSSNVDVSLFGYQLENLSYATSYIPTNGSTQTRAAETCNGAGTSSILPSEEGILYIEAANIANDSTDKKIAIGNGTNQNVVVLQYTTISNQIRAFVSNGSLQFNAYEALTDGTQFNKIGIRWKVNNFALWVNGTQTDTDTSGTTFSAGTLSEFAFDDGGGNADFYGKIRDIRVYNTKEMTDSEVDILLTKITS